MSVPLFPKPILTRLCKLEKQNAELEKQIEELSGQIGHTEMAITSFTVSPTIQEVGSTVSSLTFNWTLNKVPSTQEILPVVGSIPPPALTTTVASSLTSNTTFTLTVSDGSILPGNTATATATVSFRHKAYWGTASASSLDSLGILGLPNSAFATSRTRTFTVDGGGQYIYYSYPASFGDASFSVNGFPTSGWVKTQVSFLNASGNLTLFNVYRSAEVQNGTGIIISVT